MHKPTINIPTPNETKRRRNRLALKKSKYKNITTKKIQTVKLIVLPLDYCNKTKVVQLRWSYNTDCVFDNVKCTGVIAGFVEALNKRALINATFRVTTGEGVSKGKITKLLELIKINKTIDNWKPEQLSFDF